MSLNLSIRPMIYTTNIIERTIEEIKRRIRMMNSLPTEEAAENRILTCSRLQRKMVTTASAWIQRT